MWTLGRRRKSLPAVGEVIDAKYRVERVLGTGGMGIVLNNLLEQGKLGLVVRLDNYNGESNGRNVEVSLFLASRGLSAAGGPPEWNGNDRWDVEPTSVVGGEAAGDAGRDAGDPDTRYASLYVDTSACVTNGVLVSVLGAPRLELGAGRSTLTLSLAKTVVTAKIERLVDGGYALRDGQLAARWPTRSLLKNPSYLQAPGLGADAGYLCGDNKIYAGIKSQLCELADIPANAELDKAPPAPCDGVSFALGFSAVPARFGGVRRKPPQTPGCGEAYDDRCPKN